MTDANFANAPPAKSVDGLLAVPIDIEHISTELIFDGSSASGTGDATVNFIVGPQDGNPIFDLRQTITGAWLDGVPLPVSKLMHHDFGGGEHSELRVVESILSAGTSHCLRVTYELAIPQASTAGSYQPALTWNTGPRLVFNFGFTDLGAGRYLESWIPANLIFDQFELIVQLQLLNTSVPHTVITNGIVVPIGANQWSVTFPSHYTALSHLLEIRATDTLTNFNDTVTLPVSGKLVTLEAWKLSSSAINLSTEVNNIKSWLVNNELTEGAYLHENRFVAFMNVGGMEYEGGTTSTPSALSHETFHSWWGRGIKPASQPDGWWDEAWTVYIQNGGIASLPFDFSEPPVQLRSSNPWVRITTPGSYTSGFRFFQGLAALLGIDNLRTIMSEFYNLRKDKPVTTMDLEEFLLCRSGRPQLVDAFHRFVYGFTDPATVTDLWFRDEPSHHGAQVWPGSFWDSPDLWIRNSDDDDTTHQNPEYGQDNWFYARVRNLSSTTTARHFIVTFNVKGFAGTEFLYPSDFLPCIAAASGFELGPGESRIVKSRWPAELVPPPGAHGCLLAAVLCRSDHPLEGTYVWESNNLAQKNMTIVDLPPGSWIVVPFQMSNLKYQLSRKFFVEIHRPRDRPDLEVSLIRSDDKYMNLMSSVKIKLLTPKFFPDKNKIVNFDCGSGYEKRITEGTFSDMITSENEELLAVWFKKGLEASFPDGNTARIQLKLSGQEQLLFGLRVRVPLNAKPGEKIRVDLAQRVGVAKKILGGIAVEVRVR